MTRSVRSDMRKTAPLGKAICARPPAPVRTRLPAGNCEPTLLATNCPVAPTRCVTCPTSFVILAFWPAA